MKKIRPSRGESRRRATKLGRNAASNSKYPVHFCLECFIRSTVPQDLSRKTVGPQLHTQDRIFIVTVDSLSLWQESADQAVVVLNGTFFTGSIRMIMSGRTIMLMTSTKSEKIVVWMNSSSLNQCPDGGGASPVFKGVQPLDCIKMVVTMNPCKCGWHGRPSGHCIDLICSPIHRHMIFSRV